MIDIVKVRHSWPEKAGFRLVRENWNKDYIFLHFFNSVEITFNGKTIVTAPDSVIIFRPTTHHSFCSKQPLRHNWFHFSVESEDEIERFGLEFDKIYQLQHADFITKIVKSIEIEFFSPKPFSNELVISNLIELLIRISRMVSGEGEYKLNKTIMKRLERLREEMFLNLDKSWSVEKLAYEVGLSNSRFYTVYRQAFGNSPIDDLISARIESAREMLRATDNSINQIAESLGYGNTTHFIRQFKKVCGITPQKFRKENR